MGGSLTGWLWLWAGALMAPFWYPGMRPPVLQRLLDTYACLWKAPCYLACLSGGRCLWCQGILLCCWNQLHSSLFHSGVLAKGQQHHTSYQHLTEPTEHWQQPSGGLRWHGEQWCPAEATEREGLLGLGFPIPASGRSHVSSVLSREMAPRQGCADSLYLQGWLLGLLSWG